MYYQFTNNGNSNMFPNITNHYNSGSIVHIHLVLFPSYYVSVAMNIHIGTIIWANVFKIMYI